MKLFVGLDVSSFDMKACFLDGEGKKVTSFTVSNDLPGVTRLRDAILDAVQGQQVDVLQVGLESTAVYSFHPSMFLHSDQALQALNVQVLVMNPKQTSNFKKGFGDKDKTDEIDAFIIADYLRFGRLPMSVVKEKQYIALQQLTRSRYQLTHQLSKEKPLYRTTLEF